MAAAMLMTSCTNEDDLAGGSNNQRLNSDVPIVLSAGQQANKTRASLGNVDDATGKYDGTFDTPAGKNLAARKRVYVSPIPFCRGKPLRFIYAPLRGCILK